MLARAQLEIPGAQPVPACPACAQSRKIQFWEGVIFLHNLHKIDDIWIKMPKIKPILLLFSLITSIKEA